MTSAPAWVIRPPLFVYREPRRWWDRTIWQLAGPLVYDSAVLAERIEIPAGYLTDLASVPRLPLVWLLAGGAGTLPAIVHDWLCDMRPWSALAPKGKPLRGCDSSETAADVFDEALRIEQVPPWRRVAMVESVRCCGPRWNVWPGPLP